MNISSILGVNTNLQQNKPNNHINTDFVMLNNNNFEWYGDDFDINEVVVNNDVNDVNEKKKCN